MKILNGSNKMYVHLAFTRQKMNQSSNLNSSSPWMVTTLWSWWTAHITWALFKQTHEPWWNHDGSTLKQLMFSKMKLTGYDFTTPSISMLTVFSEQPIEDKRTEYRRRRSASWADVWGNCMAQCHWTWWACQMPGHLCWCWQVSQCRAQISQEKICPFCDCRNLLSHLPSWSCRGDMWHDSQQWIVCLFPFGIISMTLTCS